MGAELVEVDKGAPVPVLLSKNCHVYRKEAPPIEGVWSSKKILSPAQKMDWMGPPESPSRVIKFGCGDGTITIFAVVTCGVLSPFTRSPPTGLNGPSVKSLS